MRAIVVGAGAWGLPTATELAHRGHTVTLIDRHGPGNTLSSSSGPTRLWRIADPEPAAIRLGRRALASLLQLEDRLGRAVHTDPGLVWRDSATALRLIKDAVRSEEVAHTEIQAGDVGRFFPGLQSDDRDAVWFPEAGSLLSAELLSGYQRLFAEANGDPVYGAEVRSVTASSTSARVTMADGQRLDADTVVVCAGPGTSALLSSIGLQVPLRSYLEQVVHLGRPAEPHLSDDLPCLFDGPMTAGDGIYAMPTPGVGYKIGIDRPLRELLPGDTDRVPDPEQTGAIVNRFHGLFPTAGGEILDEFVCCWTDSPDGWFVIDRTESVVVACGDAGKGFKYSPVMGEILADLAEGLPADPDVAAMSGRRFEGHDPGADWSPTSLGDTQARTPRDRNPHD